MSEAYIEKYRGNYSEMMEFMISSSNSWALCADAPYLMGAGHPAATAPVSLTTAGGASPVQV